MLSKNHALLVRLGILFPALATTTCNTLPFDAVSIRPIYGWVDGCTSVKVSGHGFGADVTVQIGGNDLLEPSLPDADSLDYGYQVTGLTPPAASATGGLASVSVTTGGETSVVEDAFYYEPCSDVVVVEWADPTEGVAEGTAILLVGCNLSTAYSVHVGDSAPVALASVCSTAQASFAAPARDDGAYYIGFFDGEGNRVWPGPECDILSEPGSWAPDTGDTADSAQSDPCHGVPVLTYGGAR